MKQFSVIIQIISNEVLFSIDIFIFVSFQPKLYTRELLDLVSSHFKLKEKEYFGINFTDDT